MRVALLSILLVLAVALAGYADVPQTMSYQGVLRDAGGNVVADGSYGLTFKLYNVAAAGVALWTETQTVTVEDGIFNAILGSTNPLGLPFDVPYWLGIAIEGEAELSPRVELTAVPYARRAAYADGAPLDDDWIIVGNNIFRVVGYVGIGNSSPIHELDIKRDADSFTGVRIKNDFDGANSREGIYLSNEDGDLAGISTYDDDSVYASALAIFNNRPGGNIRLSTGGTERVRIDNSGNVGIGEPSPSSKLDVGGTAEVTGFQMATGAAAGRVLTSDASGVATWQAPAGASDGDWTIAADDMYSAVAGDVGIGTSSPGAKLGVSSDAGNEVLEVKHGGTYTRLCNFERTSIAGGGNDIVQIKVPTGSPDNFQFIECERGATVNFAVDGDGFISSASGAALNSALTVDHDGAQAGTFTTDYAAGDAHVVHAEYTGGDPGANTPIAVYGEAQPMSEQGAGGLFYGGYIGVRGVANVVGTGYRKGVSAEAWNGDYNYAIEAKAGGGNNSYGIFAETSGVGIGRAVRAHAHGMGTNYALSATAESGMTNYAGYFIGDVEILGTLSKTAGTFKIDHPLDPEGQYLQHSFVESPDMMNVYNGNVVLDGRGEAWIELPDWFEALNRDFRYQLTCIGGFAPVYVAEKILGNRFKVAGGESGMEVSWQVTGVRQDPYAEAHRVQVEVPKAPGDVGKYVSPEVYGRPIEDAIGYEAPPERTQELVPSGPAPAARERPSPEDE